MRAPGGKMGKDSFSYDQKLFSAHEQLPELRPGDNSNSEETNATIIETSPGKSSCSGCLKLGQTEQWQHTTENGWQRCFLSLQLFCRISLLLIGKLRDSGRCKLDVQLFNHRLSSYCSTASSFFCVMLC